jgi:hypothetical protein
MLAAAKTASAHPGKVPLTRLVCYQEPTPIICLVEWWRRDTWRLQGDLARPRTATRHAELRTHDPTFRDWIRRLWKRHALRLERLWPPWSRAWFHGAMCVHPLEGPWDAPGGIGPDVSGGMQIGRHEWITYGGGFWAPEAYLTAPRHQLLVAWRYWRVSGWGPWPNTAARCGLL